MKISVISGTVHSGKSTFLQAYVKDKLFVGGILSPVLNNERYFQNILGGEIKKMETTIDDITALKVGKFHFSQNAFNWACNIITEAIRNQNEIVIIDEIGPLELLDNGFANLLTKILEEDNFDGELILVIRESKVEEILKKFSIQQEGVNFIDWKH